MPGMMDTVLNLGLNDAPSRASRKPRRRPALRASTSYRRFIQMYANVVLGLDHHMFEEILDDRQGSARRSAVDTALDADDWQRRGRRLQAGRRDASCGERVPAGSARPALGRDRRGVRQLDERSGEILPPHARHPRSLGHRGQRPGDGVRQHGRDLAPPASPLPATPRPARPALYGEFLVNAQGEDVVAGIRTPQALTRGGARGDGRHGALDGGGAARGVRRVPEASSSGSNATTATCRTSSSRSSGARSTCCRRAAASARPRRR